MDIHEKVIKLIDGRRSFAVAIILRAEGSTPQKVGVKAIIEAGGKIYGTLGGSHVAGESVLAASGFQSYRHIGQSNALQNLARGSSWGLQRVRRLLLP